LLPRAFFWPSKAKKKMFKINIGEILIFWLIPGPISGLLRHFFDVNLWPHKAKKMYFRPKRYLTAAKKPVYCFVKIKNNNIV
jgi:hypothetical protein